MKIVILLALLALAILASGYTGFIKYSLSDWENVDELKTFLSIDDTDSHIYLTVKDDGTISFEGMCDKLALQLIERASRGGKRLHFLPLHPAEYRKWYNESTNRYHAICGAIVGDNEFWYIEPSNDKCWLAIYLD